MNDIFHIEEPELQFGQSKHIDIKYGILNYGVFDFDLENSPRKINVGIIGTNDTILKTKLWLVECAKKIPAKKGTTKLNLFPYFPGFNSETAFYSEIVNETNFNGSISKHDVEGLTEIKDLEELVTESVNLFIEQLAYLSEKQIKLHVIICAIPLELYELTTLRSQLSNSTLWNFRRMLKAKSLKYRIPLQLILPSTYDSSVIKKLKIRPVENSSLQDKATIAWNFFTALYYKSGGVPWRLIRNFTDLQTCYIGISFYRSLDNSSVQTSVAQVFNERGEGIIIKGAQAKFSKVDMQIHLSADNAELLLINALKKYRQEHKTLPARIVLHKTSEYNQEEIDGFISAIRNLNIELYDFLSLSKSMIRLFREKGKYPPLRGTFWDLDEENKILYTKGSIDFYQTYPGLYVPRSLHIKVAWNEQNIRKVASEILALTKMNWNNTQFDNSMPITIAAARHVGEILKYVPDEEIIESRYSFYM